MPDLRRLRRDRERAPLDVLIALRTETGDYNDSGIWVPGPHTDVVMWARREDPDTETHRTLDDVGDGVRSDSERTYMLRWHPAVQVDARLVDVTTGLLITRIEPVARRRWLRGDRDGRG